MRYPLVTLLLLAIPTAFISLHAYSDDSGIVSPLPVYTIWDESVPFPARESLTAPAGMTRQVVHRAGRDEFNFLHDVAITEFQGTLFAAWYNCPNGEMEGASVIRGRRSTDQGKTWSDVEVIAADTANKGVMYVPIAFGQVGGQLYGFISNMIGPDLVTRCEVFAYPGAAAPGQPWVSKGFIAESFLPNSAAQRLPGGNYLIAGRVADAPGTKPETPAVALSQGEDFTAPWDVVRLQADKFLPDGHELRYPETTVIVEEDELMAFVRNDSGNGLVYTGDPTGRSWSTPHTANFRIGSAKPCGGKLSTGQRYLLYTTPTPGYRELLTMAISRPGERRFSRVFQIHDGPDAALGVGPEWSYPCAVEAFGNLYVVYTSEKHHAMLATVPIARLGTS
jgi:hypothetical protein